MASWYTLSKKKVQQKEVHLSKLAPDEFGTEGIIFSAEDSNLNKFYVFFF